MTPYQKLDPQFKQTWIEALRSGEYKQGRAYLRTADDKFCCLGVACDILHPNSWTAPTYTMGGNIKMFQNKWFGIMPTPLRDEISLHETAQGRLIGMNDQGKSFDEIATWIEENL